MLPVSDGMRRALTSAAPVYDFGVDLLDGQDRVVEDISADVLSLSVEHSLHADVHRSCRLSLTRDVRWGVDRVRPWLSVWDGSSYDVREHVERGHITRTNLFNPAAVNTLALGSSPPVLLQASAYRGFTLPVTPGEVYSITRDAVTNNRFRFAFTGTTPAAGVTYFGGSGNYAHYDGALRVDGIAVPEGATHLFLYLSNRADPLPRILIERVPVAGTFFDGDTPATPTVEYAWTGTPGSATSVAREVTRWTEQTPQVHRWDLGVFLLTSPEQAAGETPATRDVTGYDKLWLLQRQVGDTYVIPAGVSYLDAIRGVLDAAGVTGQLLLQGDRQATTLAEPAVWVLKDNGYTWLDIINALLGMIGYEGLWVDALGAFRSAPHQPPAQRSPVWVFDAADHLYTIVGEERSLSADVFDAVNHWKFVRKKDRALTPDDVYVVDRTSGLAPGQVRRKVEYVDAADRAALVAEGDKVVAEDAGTERVVTFETSVLPLEHGDTVTVNDPDLGLFRAHALVRSWAAEDDGTARVELEVLSGGS